MMEVSSTAVKQTRYFPRAQAYLYGLEHELMRGKPPVWQPPCQEFPSYDTEAVDISFLVVPRTINITVVPSPKRTNMK